MHCKTSIKGILYCTMPLMWANRFPQVEMEKMLLNYDFCVVIVVLPLRATGGPKTVAFRSKT